MTQKERFRERWWIPAGAVLGIFLGWYVNHGPKPVPIKFETMFQIDPNSV